MRRVEILEHGLGPDAKPARRRRRDLLGVTAVIVVVVGVLLSRQHVGSDPRPPVADSGLAPLVVLGSSNPLQGAGAAAPSITVPIRNAGSTPVEIVGATVTAPGITGDSAALPITLNSGAEARLVVDLHVLCEDLPPETTAAEVVLRAKNSAGRQLFPITLTLHAPEIGLTGRQACGRTSPTEQLALTDGEPVRRGGTVRLVLGLRATGSTVLSVSRVRGEDGTTITASPAMPITLVPGRQVQTALTWRVRDCRVAGVLPQDLAVIYLDVVGPDGRSETTGLGHVDAPYRLAYRATCG